MPRVFPFSRQELRKLGLMGSIVPKASAPTVSGGAMVRSSDPDAALKAPARLLPSTLWQQSVAALPSAKTRAQQLADDLLTDCEVCGGGDDEPNNELLLCDREGCGRGYHQRCLSPILERVPKRRWLCPECVEAFGATGPVSDAGVMGYADNAADPVGATPMAPASWSSAAATAFANSATPRATSPACSSKSTRRHRRSTRPEGPA